MESDGLDLAIGGAALGSICTIVAAWIKAKYSKTKVDPTPLPVEMTDKFVTCEQCMEHRRQIEARLEEGSRTFREVRDDIASVRREITDGFVKLNERLDPIIRSVAANQEVLKQHLEDHRSKNG